MTISGLGLIVVAAGSSRRMGGIDKLWADLGGQPVLWHSLAELEPCAETTVLVVSESALERVHQFLCLHFPGVRAVVGGPERQHSVRLGLQAIQGCDAIAVHDAARPLARRVLLTTGMEHLEHAEAAVPAVPIADTIAQSGLDHHVARMLDRTLLRAVQTPQVFRVDALRNAHDRCAAEPVATDDASLLLKSGYTVCWYEGDPANIKVTNPSDLITARLLLEERSDVR